MEFFKVPGSFFEGFFALSKKQQAEEHAEGIACLLTVAQKCHDLEELPGTTFQKICVFIMSFFGILSLEPHRAKIENMHNEAIMIARLYEECDQELVEQKIKNISDNTEKNVTQSYVNSRAYDQQKS